MRDTQDEVEWLARVIAVTIVRLDLYIERSVEAQTDPTIPTVLVTLVQALVDLVNPQDGSTLH